MDSLTGFAFIAIFAVFLTGAASTTHMFVTPETSTVYPGGTVLLTCHIADFPTASIVRWLKVITMEADPITLTTNRQVDVDGDERFKIQIEEDPINQGTILVTLTIKDLKPGDSGKYRCFMPGGEKVQAEAEVIVTVPPVSLELTYHNGTQISEILGKEEFTFRSGEEVHLRCIVTGAYPKPIVTLRVGTQNISKIATVDKTSAKSTEQDSFAKHIVTETFTVTAETKALEIIPEYAGQKLGCEAMMPGDNVPTLSKSLRIRLAGVPAHIVCPEHHTSHVGEPDVIIECRVYGEPRMTTGFVYFYDNGKEDEEQFKRRVEPGAGDGKYELSIVDANGPDNAYKLMRLKFYRVFQNNFINYYFVSENPEKDVHDHTLLERDRSKEQISSASTGRLATLVTLLSCAVHLFFRL